MSICNYCILQSIKKQAKLKGYKVTILYDAKWGLGGVNVYVHPKSIKISDLSGGEDGERKQYRKAWMMEIPVYCCC